VRIKKEPEKLDAPFKLLMYDTDENGRCVPSYVHSEYSDDVNTYYEQRSLELNRLLEDVLEGRLSPIGLFVQYQHMHIKDVAKRVGLRSGQVEKHMTLSGFKTATVEMLIRYARVFDVTVSDFFEFTETTDNIAIVSNHRHDRLINRIQLHIEKPQ
jgi:hypothetical protein